MQNIIVHTNDVAGYLKGQMQSSVMWYMCWIMMENFQTALNAWSEKFSIKEWFPVRKENGLGLSYQWWVLKWFTKIIGKPYKLNFLWMCIHVDTCWHLITDYMLRFMWNIQYHIPFNRERMSPNPMLFDAIFYCLSTLELQDWLLCDSCCARWW